MKLKRVTLFLLFISCFFSLDGFSQEIQGEWKIDNLMLDSLRNEYILSSIDTTVKRWRYSGNHFSFKGDGSFRCWYTAPCTMGCFPTSEGKFALVDEHHIRFTIDTVHQHGRMCGLLPEQTFPLDVGLFYIHKYDGEIRLIKSDGNLEQDQLNLSYIEFIEECTVQNGKLTDLFEEIESVEKVPLTPKNIVELYSSSIAPKECTFLYLKEIYRYGLVVLVEVEGKLKCIYSEADNNDGELFIRRIKISNTGLMDELDSKVSKIESRSKKGKREVSVDDKKGVNSTATIFERKGQVEKVILERKFSRGMETITYYLKDDTVFFARVEVDGGDEKSYSGRDFYLRPNGEFGSKELARSATGGIHPSKIYYCRPYLNAILENKN